MSKRKSLKIFYLIALAVIIGVATYFIFNHQNKMPIPMLNYNHSKYSFTYEPYKDDDLIEIGILKNADTLTESLSARDFPDNTTLYVPAHIDSQAPSDSYVVVKFSEDSPSFPADQYYICRYSFDK